MEASVSCPAPRTPAPDEVGAWQPINHTLPLPRRKEKP